MTCIEFFDKNMVENLCSSLICSPERVILIGCSEKKLKNYAQRFGEILSESGKNVEFICKKAVNNNMPQILDVLTEIVNTYDDCYIDLTGGEDVFLAAAGIILERFRDKNIQMHRINVRNNMIYDCDMDGKTVSEFTAPMLSIETNIRLYGGGIVFQENNPGATYRWEWSREFEQDIDKMWEICRQDVKEWNLQISILTAATELGDGSSLDIDMPASRLKSRFASKGASCSISKNIYHSLYKSGLINGYHCSDERLVFSFKNEQIKRCLTTAGRVLEMKICLAARRAAEKDGTPIYNDVMSGVCIDWDGDASQEQEVYDIENEIDVMMMHGMVPVFVSCKNGKVDINELYKLTAVADRFGGKYAKKVLVASALDPLAAKFLKRRASDMGIVIIDDAAGLTDKELEKRIGRLWSCN